MEVLPMKKRLLSIVMTMAIAASLFAVFPSDALATTYTGDFSTNLRWELDTVTGTLNITRRWDSDLAMQDFGSTGAPWYQYRGAIRTVVIEPRITRIGNNAFADCLNLSSVTIPPQTASIGDQAFRGAIALKSIVLPASLRTMGAGVFNGCVNLVGIGIGAPAGLQNGFFRIDNSAANGVVLFGRDGENGAPVRLIKASAGTGPTYAIPSTVTAIEQEAFAYSSLTEITIPASVNTIGRDAFSWSTNLAKATFEGHAPQNLPSGNLLLFDNVAGGFTVYYYPYTSRWPTPPNTNWRGYTAIAMTSYVTLDRMQVALAVGRATQLIATVHPTNASQAVTWSSGDTDIATVSPDGAVRGQSIGETLVTATTADGRASRSCLVQVVDLVVPVTGVSLDKAQLSLTAGGDSGFLTATVHPSTATNPALTWTSSNPLIAYVDVIPQLIDPMDPNFDFGMDPDLAQELYRIRRMVIPVSPGTATITVRTADGNKSASCTVTVKAPEGFVPVSDVVLDNRTIPMGARINLNDLAKVRPDNATNREKLTWSIISYTLTAEPTMNDAGDTIDVPFGQLGTIVVQATVTNGLADVEWGYAANTSYTKTFELQVGDFIPVTSITDVPDLAFAGVPLTLKGTVIPFSASNREITWSLGQTNTAGVAQGDVERGLVIAQWPGVVQVQATVRNGLRTGPTNEMRQDYTQTFTIRVDPYTANGLTLRANPGGTVSSAPSQLAGGETVTISASPNTGYVFAGWHSTNGGTFADANRATTQFTMPRNETTVTAFFTFTGLPGGGLPGDVGGGTVLPTPIHYFTNNSIYMRYSTVSFGHVTVRDFHLFSHVTLDGRTLTRNSHYTTGRTGSGFTEVILSNGYLDALNQGSHTLQVHFRDYVSVSAVFTVLWREQTSQTYDDVYTSDWYFSSVDYVTSRGWMSGRAMEPRQFRPSEAVTQGEAIDALYRMAGSPSVLNQHGQPLQGRDASFEWVRQNGILPIGGVYNLDHAITRQDVALLFNRLATVLRLTYPVVREAPNFADEWQIDPNARNAVVRLFRAGVIGGRTATSFVPLGQTTRAEYAATLHRFAEAVGRW